MSSHKKEIVAREKMEREREKERAIERAKKQYETPALKQLRKRYQTPSFIPLRAKFAYCVHCGTRQLIWRSRDQRRLVKYVRPLHCKNCNEDTGHLEAPADMTLDQLADKYDWFQGFADHAHEQSEESHNGRAANP